ncbi:MAG TPA: TetR family transcriptional regulator [Dissulfurispiraceae bacterium]
MSRNPADSEARRKIIDTALDLFYRQGYLATGINQVIADAGVSKNTFYYYFPSKEDLCVAYLQERHKVWMGWLNDAVNEHFSPYERLLCIFDFLEKWLKKCDYRGCAFLNIASEIPDIKHRIRKEVIGHKNELRVLLKGLIKAVKQSDRKYAHLDVDFVADALYVIFEGVISSCQNYGDTVLLPAARKNFERLLKVK